MDSLSGERDDCKAQERETLRSRSSSSSERAEPGSRRTRCRRVRASSRSASRSVGPLWDDEAQIGEVIARADAAMQSRSAPAAARF
jgi:hypothetical protein